MKIFTIYSDGAMNSIVADRISGRRCGSPYVFDTGSNENSSGTGKEILTGHDDMSCAV